MAKHILMINGPNLNLLGLREPHIYGHTTLSTIQSSLSQHCASLSPPIHFSSFQSNHEGEILDVLHSCHPKQYSYSQDPAIPKVDAIVINPGGLTHTSVVLRDALAGVGLPFVEIHITNVHTREAFRQQSFLSEKAAAVLCGLGVFGYRAAVDFFAQLEGIGTR